MDLAKKLSKDMAFIIANKNESLNDGCLFFLSTLNLTHKVSPSEHDLTINVNDDEFIVSLSDPSQSNPRRSHVDVYQEVFYKAYYLNLVESYNN